MFRLFLASALHLRKNLSGLSILFVVLDTPMQSFPWGHIRRSYFALLGHECLFFLNQELSRQNFLSADSGGYVCFCSSVHVASTALSTVT